MDCGYKWVKRLTHTQHPLKIVLFSKLLANKLVPVSLADIGTIFFFSKPYLTSLTSRCLQWKSLTSIGRILSDKKPTKAAACLRINNGSNEKASATVPFNRLISWWGLSQRSSLCSLFQLLKMLLACQLSLLIFALTSPSDQFCRILTSYRRHKWVIQQTQRTWECFHHSTDSINRDGWIRARQVNAMVAVWNETDKKLVLHKYYMLTRRYHHRIQHWSCYLESQLSTKPKCCETTERVSCIAQN